MELKMKYKPGDIVKYYYPGVITDLGSFQKFQNTHGMIRKHIRTRRYSDDEYVEEYIWYSFVAMKDYELGDKVLCEKIELWWN